MSTGTSTTEIVIQAAASAATVAAVVVALWGDWFRSKVAAPKLRIELPAPVGTFVPLSSNSGRLDYTKHIAFYVHCKVVNDRKWVRARNVRVLLRAIHRMGPDGRFMPVPLSVPLQFVWSNSEITPPAVDIQDEQYFDLGCIVNPPSGSSQQFLPAFYITSNNFRGNLQANECLRYSLQIQAEHFASERFSVIEVAWDGKWNENPEVMREHLRISAIHG